MVSRASVREALRALESRGLVEIRAGEGAFVRDVSVEALVEPLALGILPHREAVGELFEARRLLEPAIAALAARRATDEEMSRMERILEEQGREVSEGRTGLAQDSAFHAALARGATTERSPASSTPHGPPAEPRAALQVPARRVHQDHRRILDAIRGRDEMGPIGPSSIIWWASSGWWSERAPRASDATSCRPGAGVRKSAFARLTC
jgi:GntR family transcriptional repressor for pyruvate dehydrogenase complex